MPGLSTLPSLETNLACAPDTHTQAVGGPLRSIYTPSAKAGGKGCRSRATPSVPFPPLPRAWQRAPDARQGELPVYPASSGVPGILQGAQLLLGVDCAVTHSVDEKPESQAKIVMVFFQPKRWWCAARQLQWIGPPRFRVSRTQAQGRHKTPPENSSNFCQAW